MSKLKYHKFLCAVCTPTKAMGEFHGTMPRLCEGCGIKKQTATIPKRYLKKKGVLKCKSAPKIVDDPEGYKEWQNDNAADSV